uniref:Tetratricopeptide repeat protein 37 n=1 Tax=Cacopsylla melanoneura TaxID=428564 RepID=A0A8D8YPA9_9HEMI
MTSSADEIKAQLRTAKNCLKEQEYQEALKLLTRILKADNTNFNAYVYCAQAFSGLQDDEKSIKALKKALEIRTDQIVPWLMLCKIYENKKMTNEVYKELIVAYENMLQLEDDVSQWLEYCKQVDSHTCQKKDQDQYILTFSKLLTSPVTFKKNKTAELLSDLFLVDKNHASPHVDVFVEAFSTSVLNLSEDREKRFKKIPAYFHLLFKLKRFQDLIDACERVLTVYDSNVTALEWMCKTIIVFYFGNPGSSLKFNSRPVTEYIDTLIQSSPTAAFLGFTAHGVELIKQREYVRARDEYLLHAVEMKTADWQSYFALAKVHSLLHCYEEAERCIEQVYKRLSDTSSLKRCYNMDGELAEVLCNQSSDEKKRQGLNLCLELLSETDSPVSDGNTGLLINTLRAAIDLDNGQVFEQFVTTLSEPHWKLYIGAYQDKKLKNYKESLVKLSECIQLNPAIPEVWMLRADVLNSTGDYAEAMQAHLKVASLAAHWFEPFYILGKYYHNYKRDLNTAKRCFLKAFQLNPRSDSVGIALSDIYRSLGLAEENVQLLEAVTTFGAKWAKLRLGLQLMDSGEYQKSINHLRSAARSDPNDAHCWEALGDGYLKRGAFSAAKKCYAKVVTLQSDKIYPKLQIANIYQILGLAEESIAEYRTILLIFPECLPAMKGLAESCLLLVRKRLQYSGNLVREAHDLCQTGVNAVVSALMLNNGISCVWKLLGDLLVTVCKLPKRNQTIDLPASLVDPTVSSGDQISTLATGQDILAIALNAYKKALAISKTLDIPAKLQSRLVYSIAYCLHLDSVLSSSPDKKKAALKVAKQCVRMSPGSYPAWNMLGVIAASDDLQLYPLAQHAFIKSIQVERVNPTAWTNLGSVYLKLRCLNLANDCFKEAQTIDPAYIMAWLGQTTVAEDIDHPDTMKMLHHTCTLGSHHNSIVSFSYHVLRALQHSQTSKHVSLNKLYAEKHAGLPLCSVQMDSSYVKEDLDPACVLNLKGCLSVWSKDYKTAIDQFSKALEVTEEDKKDLVRGNLLVAYLENSQHEDAIKLVSQLEKHTFESLCALGFCYNKDNEYETSYKTYEDALTNYTSSTTDHQRAELNFVLAANCYSGGDMETAKSLLFQSLQIKVSFTAALFALSALGILSGDLELTRATCKELEVQQTNTHVNPASLLMVKCYTAFMQENLDLIELLVNDGASNVKSSSKLLTTITRLCQQLSEHTKTPEFSRIALALAYSSSNITQELGTLICYLHLSIGQNKVANSQLIYFINMFPNSATLYALLIAAYRRQGIPLPLTPPSTEIDSTPLSQWLGQLSIAS